MYIQSPTALRWSPCFQTSLSLFPTGVARGSNENTRCPLPLFSHKEWMLWMVLGSVDTNRDLVLLVLTLTRYPGFTWNLQLEGDTQ